MKLTKRQQQLLKRFVTQESALSYSEIAALSGASTSTARNDIRFISIFLSEQFHINFHKDPSNRLFLEKEDIRTICKAKLPLGISIEPDTKARLLLLISHLLFSPSQTLSVQKLADLLYISRPTAYQLLGSAEKILSEYQVTIQKGSPSGLVLLCSESAWRKAAAALYQQLRKHGFVITNRQIKPYEASSLETVSCEILEGFLPGLNVSKILSLMMRFEKDQGIRFIDHSFERLCVYVSLCIYRLRQGHVLEPTQTLTESDIRYSPAYPLSLRFVQLLSETFQITIPETDTSHLTILFLCSNLEYLDREYRYSQASPQVRDFVDELIQQTGHMLNRHIIHDRQLYDQLIHYIPVAVSRLRYHFTSYHGSFDSIRKQYSKLFAIVWSTNLLFNRCFHVELNKEESCCLVLFLAAALERAANHLRAVIAWKSDTGLGEIDLLAAMMEKDIPNLSIIDILPIHQLTARPYHRSAYDFVISNCPIEHPGKRVVQINSIPTSEDIEAIHQAMLDITELEKLSAKTRTAMRYLLHSSDIVTGVNAANKNEILKNLCGHLTDSGNVTPAFYDSVLYREAISSTYIGNGLVFTHGDSEQVLKSALSIALLSHPIPWDDVEVDLVFVYAFNLDDLEQNNIEMDDFFVLFVDITHEEELMNELRSQKTPEDFYQTFLSYF